MENYKESGTLVLSLDFEMMWGIIDCFSPEKYGRSNVEHVPEVIRRIVELLEKYNAKATFGTVGFILAGNIERIKANIPDSKPSYQNTALSAYENNYIDEITARYPQQFFANESVELLKQSKQVEIGSHTYCHYYCWEKGQTIAQFEADMKKGVEIAMERGIEQVSIIFPRNQVTEDYLGVCCKYGIIAYRGNAKRFFEQTHSKLARLKNKVMRLLDTYISVAGNASIPYNEIDVKELPVNIPASRLLRPYNKNLAFLESLKLRRIRKEIKYAAMHKELYHLWWHPHNFGANIDENVKMLEQILESFAGCREKYGMRAMTMQELAQAIIDNNKGI